MTRETIRVNDKRIVIRRGAGSDSSYPALFCIHGNLGSGRWFEKLLDAYPGPALAPDLPNFGGSDHIDRWSIEAYGEWAVAIMKNTGIQKAAVLGHSLGGAVAMEVLNQVPEMVRDLILIDSSPVEGLLTPKEHYPIIEAYKSDRNILAQALKGVVPTLTDNALFELLVEDAWKMSRDCFIGHAEALGAADYREKLADRPTGLTVHVSSGAMDPLITTSIASATASFFGTGAHVFSDCGHSPMVEKPSEFAEYILKILSPDSSVRDGEA